MASRYLIGEFELDPATRRLRRGGESVHLPNRPFRVLQYLVECRDRLVPRAELLEQFWDGREVYDDALTRCVSTIRKALGSAEGATEYVETRWADGYRFVGPCRDVAASARDARRRPVRAPARDPSHAGRLIRRGNAYLSRSGNRNYRYALDMFGEARAIDPEDARAHGGIAASHALLYQHERPTSERRATAIESLRTALELEPMHAEVQLARAQVALMLSDHAGAQAAFRQAESLDPGFSVWYYHGRECAVQADHEGAVIHYMRAREADPADFQALALAEQSLRRVGLHADARRAARDCVAAAERVLARRPDDVRALSLAACVLPQLGRKAEAIGWSERAATLEPDEPFVNFNASCVYIALGDYERALRFLRRVTLSAEGNHEWISQDPTLDPVRSHPQFAALLKPADPQDRMVRRRGASM